MCLTGFRDNLTNCCLQNRFQPGNKPCLCTAVHKPWTRSRQNRLQALPRQHRVSPLHYPAPRRFRYPVRMLTSLLPRAGRLKNYQKVCKIVFVYFSSTSNKTRDRFKICGCCYGSKLSKGLKQYTVSTRQSLITRFR